MTRSLKFVLRLDMYPWKLPHGRSPSSSHGITRGGLGAVCLAVLLGGPAAAQERFPAWGEVFVGSELESYLRMLQTAGKVDPYPWSIQGFSVSEVERLIPKDSIHPWGGRYRLDSQGGKQPAFAWIRPRAHFRYNSAFPAGANDGPVWTGRGLTSAVQAGFALRYGPLSAVVAPVAFRAENREFELLDNRQPGPVRFAHGREMAYVDLPQRFGDGPYQRLDPGQSTVRLDLAGVAAGVSTANQQWGPGIEHPILLGNNAPGYPHLFFGTSRPVNLGLGTVHARLVWGELAQSDYSVVPADSARRFASGLVGVLGVRGVPGLEIGASRFFHVPWPDGQLTSDDFLKPIEALLKERLPDRDTVGADVKQNRDNQLASVFFRWAVPGVGFEIYGEYARDDHNWNTRDLILEPDHMSGYLLGFGKVWRREEQRWVRLRGEVLNTRPSHLLHVRNEVPFGLHGFTRQGHTHRGQLLGSPAIVGGGAALLAVDLYRPDGRWTFEWERAQRGDNRAFFERRVSDPRGLDVVHTLSAEGLVFRGPVELLAGVEANYNLNRNFSEDVLNWGVAVAAMYRP